MGLIGYRLTGCSQTFFGPKNFDKKWRQPTADVVVAVVSVMIVVAVDFMVVVIVIVVVVIAVVAVPVVVNVVVVVVTVVVVAIVTFVFNLDILRLMMSQVKGSQIGPVWCASPALFVILVK